MSELEVRERVRATMLAEHAGLERSFENAATACAAADHELALAAWAEFETAFEAHLDFEERALIPALARVHARDARALSREHEFLRKHLSELSRALREGSATAQGQQRFLHELRAHANHEARLLYARGIDELPESEQAAWPNPRSAVGGPPKDRDPPAKTGFFPK